ncbi:MAG: HU family DNA-binding protein [Muribaculaceae bacterium]|nr:HU family DNA-binding protein [Bacteroidales bacterium]MBD5304163.1 HU family DNA-binding protein [Bacteroides sp.]MDE6072285.1 HU family DNA-binding protein [Muribaculaceae bacterium]
MDNKTLIDTIAKRLDKSREEISEMTEAFGLVMADILKAGDVVAIPTVGTFETKLKAERVALHPSSGKKLLVPPKITINFKPSTLLKQKIR